MPLWQLFQRLFDASTDSDIPKNVPFTLVINTLLTLEWERDIEAGTSVLHQRAFTEKLLKAFGFWEYSKPTKTPQAPGTRLSAADKPSTPDPVLHRRYRAIVGALGWLNQGTRPDTAKPIQSCRSVYNALGRSIWTRLNTA